MQTTRLGLSLLIVVLLTGAIFYPGALTEPYSEHSVEYSISTAPTDTLDNSSQNDVQKVTVDEFSEGQRRAFEKAKEQTSNESEWQSVGNPSVCDSSLLLCNEYKKFPNPANEGDTDHTTVVVEDSSEESYLVRIGRPLPGAAWDLDGVAEFVTKLLILGPFVIFLSYRARIASSGQLTLTSMGYGSILVVLVFSYPYFLMFTDRSFPSWHLRLLAVTTWGVILAESWRSRTET